MKKSSKSIIFFLCAVFFLSGCAANKTKKGAAVGVVGGGAMGAVIGRASGNTAMGAIIGAAVGGTTGALIGRKMDKQAEELKKTVPDAKVERVGEGIVVEFSSDVLYGFDQSALSAASKTSLDKLVKVLNVYPDTDIEIQGHTDSKGSESYNQGLSERRAASAANYVKNMGIASNRVNTRGFGELQPKYSNDTSTGQGQNRRVEFLITANEKMKAEVAKEASK
jgi:outer membrane protein OmpA-like peptidoglycan-associated protein